MENKTIIDGIDVSECKWHTNLIMSCLENPLQPSKCENDKDCYFKQRTRATEENEKLKYQNKILNKKLKPKLKNAHCVYFEGQTGLCQAKEFKKCNPINCELYTIDELSTILDLQNKLQAKEQECENLKALQRKTVQLTKEEYDRLIAKSLECEELQKTLSKTEVAKVLIQSAEINYPIIEKYNKALQ